jgi:acyl-coenzyme A synthetase/AMP-(fatty) acid ligase
MTYTNRLELGAHDRCTLLHSHNFSASRLDIFGPLLNGAAVLPFSVATEGVHRLSRWLREEEITIFHWVPSAFRHFFGIGTGSETFSGIRAVILGSEPVTSREVELYRKHFSASCAFVNRFGATETGNICSYLIDKSTQLGADVVPVGFALEDVEVLLLDEAGNEVGSGQVGEIAVRSPYFSGYWRQPELTRARFAADAASPNKTIYRSGDIGYMLPDGCLVHLGRNDLQVKVRGHRVELGRVERALLEHPEVREAAVVTCGEPPNDTRLAAYIVGKDGASLTSGALRSFLETRLPAYMVPGIFTRLNALPMTPTGKLDRRSLPEPSVEKIAADDRYVEPRNALERKISMVWSEILGVPRVGIQDRFLDLGGHSLLAGKIISRMSEVCEFEISFREFFEHPTVAQLAELLSRNMPQDIGAEELAGMLAEIESDEETLEAEKKNGR